MLAWELKSLLLSERCLCRILLYSCLLFQYACNNNVQYFRLITHKPIKEVIDDAKFAITEHNMKITGHLRIGQAIRQRGHEDFPDYEIFLYCNLNYAKKMLSLRPEMIDSCPARIIIREQNNTIVITAPLWPESVDNDQLASHIRAMNDIARKIVEYAAEDWLPVDDSNRKQ